jgi:hypothetical protein
VEGRVLHLSQVLEILYLQRVNKISKLIKAQHKKIIKKFRSIKNLNTKSGQLRTNPKAIKKNL